MTLEEVSFTNSKGHKLAGIVRYTEPVEPTKYPVVIVLHGFNEHMKHAHTADLANGLVYHGFLSLRFDFHGHGESEGDFSEHTIGQQVDDVLAALDFLSEYPMADKDRIAVVGTDIGGNIALLAAAKDARIKAVVVQGARSHFERHIKSHFHEHDIKELMRKSVYEHAQFKIRKSYVRSTDMHDVQEELKNMHAPLLLVHGVDDLRVSLNETRELLFAANEPKVLEEVPGDHWLRGEGERQTFIELAANWILRWVR